MPYIGKSPSAGVRQRYQYTATAGQTTFTGTDLGNLTLTYTDNNFVDVFQNGVLLKGGGTDYTATSGTSVVLTTGASVSDVIEIIVYDVFSVGNFFNRTDSDSRYVNVSGGTMTGSLDLNGTELVLDADGDTSITADTDDQIDIKIAGTDVGTFTQDNGKFTINSTGSNLSFAVGGTVELNTDGVQFYPGTDNTHNLGTSALRFKDMYMSGGLYVGGTGSANFFDDYEEGTIDISSLSYSTSGGATTHSGNQALNYTKVGRLVHINGNIHIQDADASGSQSGYLSIPLPFAAPSGNTYRAVGQAGHYSHDESSVWLIEGGTSVATFRFGYQWDTPTISDNDTAVVNITYQTAT